MRLRGAVWHRSVVAEENETCLEVERHTNGAGTIALRVSHASTDGVVFEVTCEPLQGQRLGQMPPLTDIKYLRVRAACGLVVMFWHFGDQHLHLAWVVERAGTAHFATVDPDAAQ